MLEDLIFLAERIDNEYIKNQLEKIKKVIVETPNDYELGQKIRKLCNR
jgi:hypothetical protein